MDASASFGWLSIVPPVVAIALAILTRQVYLSLGLFILLGQTIIAGLDPLTGMVRSAEVIIGVLGDPDNTRVLMFSAMVGAIITHLRRGERQPIVVNVVLLVLALFVAVGRGIEVMG